MPARIECLDLLKRLNRERLLRQEAIDEAEDHPRDGKPDNLGEALCECRDALADVIRRIHERTGVNQGDLWEASARAGTALGLVAHQRHLSTDDVEPVLDPGSPEGYRLVPRRVAPEIVEYRDLTTILPKLAELDRDPATALWVSEVLAQHAGVAAALGIGPATAATASASGETTGRLPVDTIAVEPHPKTKGRTKPEVVEPMIADHLKRRPHDTVREVKEAVGCSAGLVCESKAWKINQERLRLAQMSGVDPSAVKLNEKAISAAGENPRTQKHEHKAQAAALDEELDRQAEIGRLTREQNNDARQDGKVHEQDGDLEEEADEYDQEWVTKEV